MITTISIYVYTGDRIECASVPMAFRVGCATISFHQGGPGLDQLDELISVLNDIRSSFLKQVAKETELEQEVSKAEEERRARASDAEDNKPLEEFK